MTLTTFGAFPGGTLSEFTDTTANGSGTAGYGVTISASDWVAGKYKAKFKCNSTVSPVYYGDSTTVRIHMLGNVAISNLLVSGNTFYRPLSIRWIDNPAVGIFAGDEIHASGPYALANGPAPGNGFGIDVQGGIPKKLWRVRGGPDPNSSSFNQWTFGASPQPDDNGGNRRSQAWAGLTDVVTTGEWLHTMVACNFHPSNGWWELWACTHGGQMINVVPRKTGIGTCFAPPITHYPMMSMYYSRSRTGDHALEYAAGAYGNDLAEAQAWQATEIGYNPWGEELSPASNTRQRRIGVTIAGSGRNGFSADYKSGSRFATGLASEEVGEIKDLHVWASGNDASASTQSLTFGVYADSGGEPGAKLGEAGEVTVAGNATAAWHKLTPNDPIVITGSYVWILVVAGSPTNRLYYATDDPVAGGLRYGVDTYDASSPRLSDPAGAMSSDDIRMSLVADYDLEASTSGRNLTIVRVVNPALRIVGATRVVGSGGGMI